jgi:hypothetical protein
VRLVQPFADPRDDGREQTVGAGLHWPLDELRLSTIAMRREHQPSRHLVGDPGAEVATHEMQA